MHFFSRIRIVSKLCALKTKNRWLIWVVFFCGRINGCIQQEADPGSQFGRLRPQLLTHSDFAAATRELIQGKHAAIATHFALLNIVHNLFRKVSTWCVEFIVFIVVGYVFFIQSKSFRAHRLIYLFQTAICPIYFASETLLEEADFLLYLKSSPWRPRVDIMWVVDGIPCNDISLHLFHCVG